MNKNRLFGLVVVLGVVMGLFGQSLLIADCPNGCDSCEDLSHEYDCLQVIPWNGSAKVISVANFGSGSNIAVTAGGCDNDAGDNGYAYAFVGDTGFCSIDCSECQEMEYTGYEQAKRVITVSGDQKDYDAAVDYIDFRDSYNGDMHFNAEKMGCQYIMNGSNAVLINVRARNKDDVKSDVKFSYKIEWYGYKQNTAPNAQYDYWHKYHETTGTITITVNQNNGFDPLSFKPSPQSGSNVAWIKKIHRAYVDPQAKDENNNFLYPDINDLQAQSEWSWQTSCDANDLTGICYFYCSCLEDPECDESKYFLDGSTHWFGPIATTSGSYYDSEYYRAKVPAWSKDVECTNGLPGYMSNNGWAVNVYDNYIYYSLGGSKTIYFNCGTSSSSGDKNLISNIEYCPNGEQQGQGVIQWRFNYNANDQLEWIHNGSGSVSNPQTDSSVSNYYKYEWADTNSSELNVAYYDKSMSTTVPQRQWHVAYDEQGNITESSNGGCSSCGGSSNFQKTEYYHTSDYNDVRFEGSLKAQYNSDGDIILYNVYDPNTLTDSNYPYLAEPLLVSQYAVKDFNTVNEQIVKIRDLEYFPDINQAVELVWIDNGNARYITYEYKDNTFSMVISKTEYETLSTGNEPTGNSFTTHYDYEFLSYYLSRETTTYPSANLKDIKEYESSKLLKSYRRDTANDVNSNIEEYTYSGYEVETQTDSRGAVTEYSYSGYDLSSVTESNCPIGISDPNAYKTTSYEYNAQHQIQTETEYSVELEQYYGWWYPVEHKIKETVYDYNNTTGFLDSITVNSDCPEYGDCNNSDVTYYKYNDFGEVIREKSPSDVVIGKAYNLAGQLESEFTCSDSSGFTQLNNASLDLISQTKYTYNTDGRIEYIYRANDTGVFDYNSPDDWVITKYEYDFLGRKKTEIIDYGNTNLTTEYEYDNQGEMVKVIEPSGKWSKTIRDGRGLTETAVVGYSEDSTEIPIYITNYSFDENGNIKEQFNPDDTNDFYYYDNFDRLYTSKKFDENNGSYTVYDINTATGDIEEETAFDSNDVMLSDIIKDYDRLGRQWRERILAEPNNPSDVNDKITLYQFDVRNNLLKAVKKGIGSTNPDTNEPNDIILETRYDSLDRPVKKIDGLGNEISFTYYTGGDVNEIIAPNGGRTKHYYDNAGRLYKMTDPDGHYKLKGFNSLNQVYLSISYDCNDTLSNLSDDSALEQVRYEYDNIGRVIWQITMKDPASAAQADLTEDMAVFYDYNDTTGLLDGEYHYINGDDEPQITRYYYDGIARKYRTVDPIGNESIVYFDSSNNTQVVKTEQLEYDPNQSLRYTIVRFFDYDDYGRLYTETVDDYNSPDFDDLTATYYYDGLGRKEREIAHNGIAAVFEYDGFGNLKRKIEDPNSSSEPNNLNRITEYGFDRLGRQSWIKGYDGIDTDGQITDYQYNKNDQISIIVYPDGNSIEYQYNSISKVQREIQRDSSSIYFGYDNRGNRIWESDDPNGNENDANFLCEYEFNGKPSLIYCAKFDNGAIMAASEFEYNGFGLTSREATALYDLNDVEILYDYDQSGNIKSRTLGNEVFEYAYDGLRRISNIKRNDVNVVDYAYIGRNTKSITYDEAYTTEAREYDQIGRLNRIYSLKDGDSNTILDLQYLYDDASNRTSVKYNHLSSPVWDKYGYDRLGRLTSVDYGSSTAPTAWIKMQGDIYLAYQAGLIWLFDTDLTDYKDILVSYKQSLEEQKTAKIKEKYEYISKFSDIALDKDFPVLTLSVMSDDTAKKDDTTTEMLYDENNNLIGKVVSGSDGNITEFTLFLDDGTYVVIDTEYSKTGEITSNLFNTYDANDNLVSSVDMLLEEQSLLASSSSESISTPMTESMSMSMMSIPVSSFGGASAPYESGESFEYDLLGNRITHDTRDAIAQTYYTNNFNQYSKINNDYGIFAYDANLSWDNRGNLQSNDFTELTYTYDYRNRLTKVEGSSSTIAEYDFDALGRRVRKLVDGTATVFYYDTMGRVIAEYKGEDSNSIVLDRSYLHGNGYNEILGMFLPDPYSYIDSNDIDWLVGFSDEWLCQSNCSYDEDSDGDVDFVDFAKHLDEDGWHTVFPASNEHYYYLKDALGSVACVIEGQYNNPEDREFYLYDAYGKPVDSSNESASGNPYGFAGMRYDGEIGLYHTLYRAYDPDLGRWIEVDPIGIVPNDDVRINSFKPNKQYTDGLSLYVYVKDNPVSNLDIWGLACSYKVGLCKRPIVITYALDDYSGAAQQYTWDHHDVRLQAFSGANGTGQIEEELTKGFFADSSFDAIGAWLLSLSGQHTGWVSGHTGLKEAGQCSLSLVSKEKYDKIKHRFNGFNPSEYHFKQFNCQHWANFVLNGKILSPGISY